MPIIERDTGRSVFLKIGVNYNTSLAAILSEIESQQKGSLEGYPQIRIINKGFVSQAFPAAGIDVDRRIGRHIGAGFAMFYTQLKQAIGYSDVKRDNYKWGPPVEYDRYIYSGNGTLRAHSFNLQFGPGFYFNNFKVMVGIFCFDYWKADNQVSGTRELYRVTNKSGNFYDDSLVTYLESSSFSLKDERVKWSDLWLGISASLDYEFKFGKVLCSSGIRSRYQYGEHYFTIQFYLGCALNRFRSR